jgi:methionyl-tRNA synthetase
MDYYVTTSIPYVNGDPHFGHAMEFVMADVLARYARQQGKKVIFSTGADEHGSKNAQKAASLNLTPQAFVDQTTQRFIELQKQLNISNNRFIRTTDKSHEQRAQIIWQKLAADIYKAKYSGWYDVKQEEFVPESQADPERKKPEHPQAYQKLEEENYFFKLSKYTEKVTEAIKSGVMKIVPETKKNEILGLLKGGLDDISISRPKDKEAWGVPVPGDDSQVMYVWFEALMNYITVLGYPENDDFKNFWPADVQVIGKDILRFHTAIWPAMLMGLGIALPDMIYAHSFVNVNGQTMSKSAGNGIPPAEIINYYGTDAFRYFFLRHIPSYNDGDFSWEAFNGAYNSELANQLGNAVSRTVAMIHQYQNDIVGSMPESEHDIASYQSALESCQFDRALEEIWHQVRGLNQYIDEEKPWVLAKAKDTEHLQEVLAYQASCLVEIAEMLVPFLPETAQKISKIFKDGLITPLNESLFPRKELPEAVKKAK